MEGFEPVMSLCLGAVSAIVVANGEVENFLRW